MAPPTANTKSMNANAGGQRDAFVTVAETLMRTDPKELMEVIRNMSPLSTEPHPGALKYRAEAMAPHRKAPR